MGAEKGTQYQQARQVLQSTGASVRHGRATSRHSHPMVHKVEAASRALLRNLDFSRDNAFLKHLAKLDDHVS